mgnify:FL=1
MSEKITLIAAAVLFAAFVANVVVGKIAVSSGALKAPVLGDVGEFLLLLAAVALFIVACLARERARSENQGT